MMYIRNQKKFPSKRLEAKPLLLMCGFGGSIWQTRLLIRTLNRDGYDVTAIDFSKESLKSGDISVLPSLVDEVVSYAETIAKKTKQPLLLVGISLGALLALNILRRSPVCSAGVLITGGDIAKIAKTLYGGVWPDSYAELAKSWEHVNMYSDPKDLVGKQLLFVIHQSKKLIDTDDIYHEIAKQRKAGNILQLVERTHFDHIGTIIVETILLPGRTKGYIRQLESKPNSK